MHALEYIGIQASRFLLDRQLLLVDSVRLARIDGRTRVLGSLKYLVRRTQLHRYTQNFGLIDERRRTYKDGSLGRRADGLLHFE